MKNLPLKLTALICAVLMWVYVALQKEYQVQVNVPLTYTHLSDLLAFKKGLPEGIEVTLEGRGIDLYRELKTPGRFNINLKDMPLGESTIQLTPSWYIPNGSDIRVSQIMDNPSIKVELDTKITKKFKIQPKLDATASQNYTLISQVKLSPDSVTLQGSRRLLRQIKEIHTEPLILENIQSDINVPIKIHKSFGPAVQLSHEFTQAFWEVDTLVKIEFQQIPVQLLRNPDPDKYFLNPLTSKVTLSGARKILSQIQASEIKPFIEFNRFQIENKESLSPSLKVLQDIKSFHIEPNLFHLDSLELTP